MIVPAIELTGSPADQRQTLDRAIAELQQLRRELSPQTAEPPTDVRGRYIDAPVWPWFFAGWLVGALFVLSFVIARMFA